MRAQWSGLVICSLSIFGGLTEASPLKRASEPPTKVRRDFTTPTATVALGTIYGTQTSVPNGNNAVNAFLGVPFALPPLGSLRFLPPVADSRQYTSPLQATKLPPSCVQNFGGTPQESAFAQRVFGNPFGDPLPENEDCLYLNIYQPATAAPADGWAVLFWIFGGNLDIGSGSLGIYDGSTFAATQNVILVTHNYRTNVFGFSNAPEISTAQQNAGFFDQRLALQWVKDNIASFGGDPNKVTIFGESAGGISVEMLMAYPPSTPPPFRAAIIESKGLAKSGSGPQQWEQLAKGVGCFNANQTAQYACMQTADPLAIQNYTQTQKLTFGPVQDGATYISNAAGLIASKAFADVPVLVGTNSEEARVFTTGWGLGQKSTTGDLNQFLVDFTGNNKPIINLLNLAYPLAIFINAYHIISQILTDAVFTCSTSAFSSALTAANYTNYRYQFAATFPNLQGVYPDPGVYHSSEILQVFGTYPRNSSTTNTQIDLANTMLGIWAGFAKDPATGIPFPKANSAATNDAGVFGDLLNPSGVTVKDSKYIDRHCAVLAQAYPIIGI